MLDEMVPLASASHSEVVQYAVDESGLIATRSHLARQIGSANLNITWDLRVIVQHQIRCC